MKKIILCCFFCVTLIDCLSQNLTTEFNKKEGKTFGEYLFKSVKENHEINKLDTLCISGCVFFQFTIVNSRVADIKYSNNHPSSLLSAVKQAIQNTDGYWNESDSVIYLQPIVYVFERNCLPTNNGLQHILWMLKELSGNQRPEIPGFGKEKPLKCIILNSLFIKNYYE